MPHSRTRAIKVLLNRVQNILEFDHGLLMKTPDEQIDELEELIADMKLRRGQAEDGDAARLANVEQSAQRAIALIRDSEAKKLEKSGPAPSAEEVEASAKELLESRGWLVTRGS